MKSILRSIKPYWLYMILTKHKTIEVAKNFPKSEEWNGIVEMYCSKDMRSFNRIPEKDRVWMSKYVGKVACRFVCDKVVRTCGWRLRGNTQQCAKRTVEETELPKLSCLAIDEIVDYAGSENREVVGWHISDLKIYDKPRELIEFRQPCKKSDLLCCCCDRSITSDDGYVSCNCKISRPPQSYMFVEELQDV